VTRLAILVVYVVRDDEDLPLLDLHLERIARHTSVPYTVLGVAHRVTDAARARLLAQDRVRLCDVPPTDLRGSREHAYYLDALLEAALATDATHVVTLDVDSFPITDRWVDTLLAAAPPESGLAAVLRTENGDRVLPHPSCLLADRSFFERYHPSFSPDWDGTAEFRRFLRATGQAGDTGIRIAYRLWADGLPWGELRRTNARDLHYLIAGIYGDAVFHLGATSRGVLFRRDLEPSLVHRLTMPLERYPARRPAAVRAKRAVLRWCRGPTERRMMRRNRTVYQDVRRRLDEDPDALFALLRGARDTAEPHRP
jgi:hypothetical protein